MEHSGLGIPAAGSRRHVAAIPYPGRGHINPMMSLCRALAARGLLVTVVVTEEWADLLSSSSDGGWPDSILFRTIPNVLPSERTRAEDFSGFIRAVYSKMEGPVEALLNGGLQPPADCVLTDAMMRWAWEVGRRRNIPVTALWTQSPTVLLALLSLERLDAGGRLPEDLSDRGDEPALSYLPSVSNHLANPDSNTSSLQLLRISIPYFSWSTTAESLLLNSIYELESQVIDTLRLQLPIPIYSLGPIIPYMQLYGASTDTNTTTTSYFQWLDAQQANSVLYISLGSFLSVSRAQMDEMVRGIHESGVQYLWVVRGELECPKESDTDRGLIVPWCYQLRVLSHPSVGGFLTHCGLNSTLEGIFSGVPMLTFPIIWDQFPNSKMIVDDWKVGLRLKDETTTEEMVVGWREIARMARELMNLDEEKNKVMRRRASELKGTCQKALEEDGSSSTDLDAFFQMISQ